MPRALDPAISKVLAEYGETPKDACWDCHGTWVVYHKAIERMAARAKIVFAAPQVIEARSADKIVAICVTGTMGDRSEWSIGEAAPHNNKNAYPYAMAEKRAKDRVVLKLLGLHGLAYSEDESDDFKNTAEPSRGTGRPDGPDPTVGRSSGGAGAASPKEAPAPTKLRDPADVYVEASLQIIDSFAGEPADLSSWWRGESPKRAEMGINKGTTHYECLYGALLAKGDALKVAA